jgi:hypothetical protein
LLSAILFSGGTFVLYRMGKKYYDKSFGVILGLALGLNPAMFVFGREATLNSLMIFFICCSLYALNEMIIKKTIPTILIAGLFLGLSVSSHYIAAPVCLLLPLFLVFQKNKDRLLKKLSLGVTAMAVGFFIGSPFFFLDFKTAINDIFSMGQLHLPSLGQAQNNELAARPHEWLYLLSGTLQNFVKFLDPWGVGFILFLIGIIFTGKKSERWKMIIYSAPVFIMMLVLVQSYHGNFYRYSLGVYIPLLIPVAMGYRVLQNRLLKIKGLRVLLAVLIGGAFFWNDVCYAIREGEADTRTLAKTWIQDHVPSGEKIFLMYPFNCPQLLMSTAQIKRLLELTISINHPRQHYYRALLHNHPGGGYDIYYWKRDLAQVEDVPQRTIKSYAAQDTIDINTFGVKALAQEKIKSVVISLPLHNLTPFPWIQELRDHCVPVASFQPEVGKSKGYILEIYDCGVYEKNLAGV